MTTTLTLPAVLAELDAVARDFGYPVDWAATLIEVRLRAKFEDDEGDNVLEFQSRRALDEATGLQKTT